MVNGPFGASVGMGLFELNPLVRGSMTIGNFLATVSTAFTAVSDIVSGETNFTLEFSQ